MSDDDGHECECGCEGRISWPAALFATVLVLVLAVVVFGDEIAAFVQAVTK